MWPFKQKRLHEHAGLSCGAPSLSFSNFSNFKIVYFSKHITFCDILDPTAPWAMPSCSINRRSSSSCFILSSSLAICTRSPWIAFISSVMLQNGHTGEYFGWHSDLKLTSPGTTSFHGSSFLREGGRERTPGTRLCRKFLNKSAIQGAFDVLPVHASCKWRRANERTGLQPETPPKPSS